MSAVDRARRARERGDGRTWRERALDAEAENTQLRRVLDAWRREAHRWCYDETAPSSEFIRRLVEIEVGP